MTTVRAAVAGTEPFEAGEHLHQRLRRAARFGNDDEAGLARLQRGEQRGEGVGVDIVHEMEARALAGYRQLGQRLAAQARAAGAEHDDVLQAPQARGDRLQRGEIVAPRRQRQQRQAAIGHESRQFA